MILTLSAIAAGILLLLLLIGKIPLSYNLRNLPLRWLSGISTDESS